MVRVDSPILITGAGGQLGTTLTLLAAQQGLKAVSVGRREFDFADSDSIDRCMQTVRPRLVVNAAAYTAVDQAETQEIEARIGNHLGPKRLAQLCVEFDIPLVHVSTDYVFDGNKGLPYLESDPTSPASVYGETKRDGEAAILRTGARAVILRTSWLYSAHGKNFVRTMLNAARKTDQLRVVADQHGTPTSAGDLAAAIVQIAAQLDAGWKDCFTGIYHATSSGGTSWYEFAQSIFMVAAPLGVKVPKIDPITTQDWPTPARRPLDSRLDCDKLERIFGCRLPHWRQPLPAVVGALLAETAVAA